MEYQNFHCEIAEGCARVSLIGPGSPEMGTFCDEFTDLMLRLQEDGAVRVVLLTDGDHSFDLHHSIDELAEASQKGDGFEMLAADEEIGRRIVTLIQESTKPIVAATRGEIQHLGFGFFMAADIRLASTDATFTAPDMAGGLMPGWGLTHTLPLLMGPGRTMEFLLSGRTLNAPEAYSSGMIDRLIDDNRWEEELDDFTNRLRHLPQPAIQLTKLGIQQSKDFDFTTMLSLEWEAQQQCWTSLETTEGLRAWQEGRAPILESPLENEEE